VASSVAHEVGGELRERFQDIADSTTRWPNAKLVSMPLDDEFDVPTRVGQLGRNSNGLRVAVFE
jgi:hypothetical protein